VDNLTSYAASATVREVGQSLNGQQPDLVNGDPVRQPSIASDDTAVLEASTTEKAPGVCLCT
jgi:hypothetical protein